ncbi:MAG: 3-phosphoshikimate 1-carboxyvinyltransferase [Cyanobacteria bacterium]|nr:3-phosphoshikimate 1-carboxyvinyltransferase [Cyanobacteriota bacterium]
MSTKNPLTNHLLKQPLMIPGDKSISHRVLMVASLLQKPSEIDGLLASADVMATIDCLEHLGITIQANSQGNNHKLSPLIKPEQNTRLQSGETLVLNAQNSGTTMRLLSGLLCSDVLSNNTQQIRFTGDDSLQTRPMERIITPLSQMGARITGTQSESSPGKITAPLTIQPALSSALNEINYTLPISSAQVKSAIIFAGLFSGTGPTLIIEPTQSRDHTERLLCALDAPLTVSTDKKTITVLPNRHWRAQAPKQHFQVPGDPSSASFWLTASACIPGSDLTISGIGLNPTRIGFLDVLKSWGALCTVTQTDDYHGEPVGSIRVQAGTLKTSDTGINSIASLGIASLIDELPVLIAAAVTRPEAFELQGAAELRVKESDRLHVLCDALKQLGYPVIERPDGVQINAHSSGPVSHMHPLQPIKTGGDHRIVMALAVLNLIVDPGSLWSIEAPESVAVSYPNFWTTWQQLQAIRLG